MDVDRFLLFSIWTLLGMIYARGASSGAATIGGVIVAAVIGYVMAAISRRLEDDGPF